MPLQIDLHAHSLVSDGTEPPYELVRLAKQAGLDVVAITDHDSTEGWAEAIEAAQELEMGLVPGLELSTAFHGMSIHLVSYLVDPENEALKFELLKIRTERRNRAKNIVNLISADFDFDWELVRSEVPSGSTVGRPHIADALVRAGLAANRSEAFDNILHRDRGYWMPLYAPTPVEGIQLIRQAGGVPVLAHPGTSRYGRVIPKSELAHLVDAGLFGLEVDHPENLEQNLPQLREHAEYFNLSITGSSDWHGTGKINRLGQHTTAEPVFERLLTEASGYRPILFS